MMVVLVSQFLSYATSFSCILIDVNLLKYILGTGKIPKIVGQDELCWTLVTEVANFSNIRDFYRQYLLTALLFLFPFGVFLVFNKPHDCFKCLGKDPRRRYSIF